MLKERIENEKYKETAGYADLVNKEEKLTLTNIIRAYQVEVSKDTTPNSYLLLLDGDGNLYQLVEQQLIANSKYEFERIQGLAKIIDIRQITNEGLTENNTGINAIAIDNESNELLLTDYLLKDSASEKVEE